jgi:predicted DNA-binding protein (UPF0251 family)
MLNWSVVIVARKRCCGLVDREPCCRCFLPEGRRSVESIELYVEELEAVRLKDTEYLEQVECAVQMGVSRATFQRILQSARQKIATALIKGLAIKIKGGNYMVKNRVFECQDCQHVWEVAPCSEGGKHGYEIPCPKCGSLKKIKVNEDVTKHACGGGHHGHGGGCCGGH